MSSRVYTVGEAVDMQLLTEAESFFLIQLGYRYEWMMPPVDHPHALPLDDALEMCRREYTVQRFTDNYVQYQDAEPVVNLTMKLLQVRAIIPMMFANGNKVVEHIVEDPEREETKLVIVPHNMSDSELESFLGTDRFVVKHRDVQYPVVLPD